MKRSRVQGFGKIKSLNTLGLRCLSASEVRIQDTGIQRQGTEQDRSLSINGIWRCLKTVRLDKHPSMRNRDW